MVDSDRRPTAQEIEELIDLVRRDPSSPAFIDLAEAYHALGRPKDAIKVCSVGLDAAPDSLERVRPYADEVVCLDAPEGFYAVGQFYGEFHQVSDEEVIETLAQPATGPHER